MKRNNKKGFTIVELVIVIAVIAILAGVLIPTFAGITNKAKDSSALQEATNVLKAYVADYAATDEKVDLYVAKMNEEKTAFEIAFAVNGGQISEKKMENIPEYKAAVEAGEDEDGNPTPATPEMADTYTFVKEYDGWRVYTKD